MCQDDSRYTKLCPLYRKHNYCEKYFDWMNLYCPLTCGTCSQCSCQDNPHYATTCVSWKDYCISNNKELSSWVETRCPKTCNKCKCCNDRADDSLFSSYCQYWMLQGYCTKGDFVAWMNINCHKTCSCGTAEIIDGCQCGKVQRLTRIVGGQETEVNEYPWMVSLTSKQGRFCGGSLIGDQWVLTAAHCTHSLSAQDFTVHLGGHYLPDPLIASNVESIIEHHQYDSVNTNYDFALIKLSNPVNFAANPHIRPVCLPSDAQDTFEDRLGTVTGWGTTVENDPTLSEVLREVVVNIMSNNDCSLSVTEQQMCAGVTEGGKDSCQGDSGGPLLTTLNSSDHGDQYQVVGVVSWGYGCAKPGYPGVYARVTSQLSWIYDTMNSDNSYRTCKA